MKRVTNLSKAGIAAFVLGTVLSGCGGGSSGASGSGNSLSDSNVGLGDGAAVLSWSAPLTRVNGESIPMAELDQYVIRFGQDSDNLSNQVVVANAQAEAEMSHEIGGLSDGTWYFTIQVRDTSGLISVPSEVVSKII